jgi:hypothetical protein
MTDDEAHIYEFMLSRRGVPFSVREISKEVDRRRADKELRWAYTPLKRLALREKIHMTNEGYFLIPLEEERDKEKQDADESLVFVPACVWCGSLLLDLVPLLTEADIFSLNATEAIFITKAQAAGFLAASPAPEQNKVPPQGESLPAFPDDVAAGEPSRRRTNPFDNIEFFGIPRRPPRPPPAE